MKFNLLFGWYYFGLGFQFFKSDLKFSSHLYNLDIYFLFWNLWIQIYKRK